MHQEPRIGRTLPALHMRLRTGHRRIARSNHDSCEERPIFKPICIGGLEIKSLGSTQSLCRTAKLTEVTLWWHNILCLFTKSQYPEMIVSPWPICLELRWNVQKLHIEIEHYSGLRKDCAFKSVQTGVSRLPLPSKPKKCRGPR